jgi:hypothetical protein
MVRTATLGHIDLLVAAAILDAVWRARRTALIE